jgi:hypothetical protein
VSAGFSPGPWEVSGSARNGLLVRAEGRVTANLAWSIGDETDEANARLIAAAPELYNGCNALLGLIQLLAANHETPPALLRILTEHHRIAEAEKAVAKARGEQ